ncbi:MAG: hypothetical protein P1U86_01600 [Verrucomicrobiales bacterium]|nr:hypothetical protein [Verrucomicrobiales bacterium]
MKRFLVCLFVVCSLSGCQEKAPKDGPVEVPPAPSLEGKDSDFVGLTVEAGEALAKKRGLSHRIVARDGEHFPATTDYRPDRLSFSVVNNRITKVTRG